jgi:hypothetical protein
MNVSRHSAHPLSRRRFLGATAVTGAAIVGGQEVAPVAAAASTAEPEVVADVTRLAVVIATVPVLLPALDRPGRAMDSVSETNVRHALQRLGQPRRSRVEHDLEALGRGRGLAELGDDKLVARIGYELRDSRQDSPARPLSTVTELAISSFAPYAARERVVSLSALWLNGMYNLWLRRTASDQTSVGRR